LPKANTNCFIKAIENGELKIKSKKKDREERKNRGIEDRKLEEQDDMR
jgi:hypothetical protein